MLRSPIRIILILTTILFFESCRKEQEQYQINKEDKLKFTKEEDLMSRVLLQSRYSGFYRILKNYKLKTINGNSKYLKDIISNTTLILYINFNQCNSCIIDAFNKIESYLKNKPNMEYIIFSSGFNLRELKLKKKR